MTKPMKKPIIFSAAAAKTFTRRTPPTSTSMSPARITIAPTVPEA
jgi:hypothetical protein